MDPSAFSDTSMDIDSAQTPGQPSTPGSTPNIFSFNPALMTPTSASLQKRRSSTRSIKRKKFDDELVESSLAKTDRTRIKLPSFPSTGSFSSSLPGTPIVTMAVTLGGDAPLLTSFSIADALATPTEPESQSIEQIPTSTAVFEDDKESLVADIVTSISTPTILTTAITTTTTLCTNDPSAVAGTSLSSSVPAADPVPVSSPATTYVAASVSQASPTPTPTPTTNTPAHTEKKKSKSSSKRSKKSRPPPAGSTKDLGRWKPTDDLALINAVQQTCDLTAVFLGVKFSCKFSLKEIQERWYALMYDSVLSKLAIQAIKQLHPDIVATVNSQALYSKDEETLLGKVTSTSQPTVDTFQELMHTNPLVFHPGRTAKCLFNHWLLMKQYHLLPDQSVPPMPKGDHVLNFSDAEDMINDEELKDPRDDLLEHELSVADRRQKREIRHLEQELPKWQVLVDSVTGISPPDFDSQTLAVLRGRLVRYLMRSREITLGRATKDNQIDVDLSLEGPAWKISRRQGVIKLKNTGDFYLANEGKRPIYIDSQPVLAGNKQKLDNNSVVEISCLRFIFLINQDLINVIRQEAQKLGT